MRRIIVISLSVLSFAAGCGKQAPVEPTTTSSSSSVGLGATISGAVMSATGSTTASVHTMAVAGLMVSVTGTELSTGVDASGQFVLKNVPGGDRQLRFTGGGVDAQVALAGVQASEQINLSVSLDGASATVESSSRAAGSTVDLEGRVESLPPTTAAASFVLAGTTVQTTGGTQFLRGDQPGTFSDLALGLRAHVKGTASGSAVLATLVQIQNTNADLPVEVNGVVQAFSGSASSFQFTIGTTTIKGDANTEFFGNSVFADLKNGVEAEVKGSQKNGYVYATRLHVNVPAPGGQEVSASIEGTLTAKSGAGALWTLTVGGTTVTTTASTEVRRRGDVQDLSVLQLGMTLHVEGIRLSDGSLSARMIQIKDDEAGAVVQIEGSMGGVKGSCPSITFNVNGYAVATNGSTAFVPACTEMKSGTKVTVTGTKQSDGSVLATSVRK